MKLSQCRTPVKTEDTLLGRRGASSKSPRSSMCQSQKQIAESTIKSHQKYQAEEEEEAAKIMLKQFCKRRSFSSFSALLIPLCCVVVLLQIISPFSQVLGFHLSFNHRLLKSVSNPQLNPANTLIRPVECRNANNHSEAGICMFAIDCMQNKGVPLSVCKHNYFVGTCCRLPDYNNFVGIVYDLRDTETNQLVEARGVPPPQPSSSDSPLLSRTGIVAGGSGVNSFSSTINPVSAPRTSEAASAHVNAAASAVSTSSTQKSPQEQSTTQLPVTKSQALKASSPVERLDEKYMISSTNLFPSTASPLPAAPLDSVQIIRDQPQPLVVKEALKLAPPNSAESARNSDGGLPSSFIISSLAGSHANKQQYVVPSELDSFHIQTTTTANANHTGQSLLQENEHQVAGSATRKVVPGAQNVYDLIKDNDSLEILSTITSVHSAPTTQQQFNMESHNAVPQENPETYKLRLPTGGSPDRLQVRLQPPQQQPPQNSVYSMIDNRLAAKTNIPQQTIVFANNHQLQSSTLRPPPQPQQPAAEPSSPKPSSLQPISDQEFTLSSVSSAGSIEEANKVAPATVWLLPSSSSPSSLSTTLESLSNSSTAAVPVSSQYGPVAGSNGWPQTTFVDLVSSGNSAQATTPFTTSLSTALLPNVSSHPYNPTTSAPPSSLVPSQVGLQLSPNVTSPTNSSLKSESSSSQRPSSSTDSATTGSVGLSQLYSSQHAASTVSNSHNKIKPHYPQQQQQQDDIQLTSSMVHNINRPNLILGTGASPALQAATKIVTGSSSTNHILPGLSNLQSAILANIPYKLASHLSSGLSNYFQTAMKPATGSRPLLSSNTAPSLQYQQQLQQQQLQSQANSSRPTQVSVVPSAASAPPAPPASVVKFPGSSSSLPPPPVNQIDLSGSSASVETTISPIAAWQFGGSSSTTSKAPSPAARDVVKEAQLVCGRPQVSQPQSNQPIGEGGKKRVARIVGGNQSSFGQWPWMVSLRQWRKGAFLHKCGAALLNENWAITAAHCVENVKVTDLLLRLGEFDVSNQEEPFPFAERRVKSVVSHPSFDPKTFEHDLALLRFAEPVKYERNIIPVCVPSGNDSYVDRMATVIGWGRLYEDGPLPDVIQHVDVPIITNNECEKMYKNAGFIEEIPDMFICAGISKGGRDSCEGDSGGPLTMVDHDGRSYLVGIISWGIGCALPSQPGVYTRITAFSGWINQITAY